MWGGVAEGCWALPQLHQAGLNNTASVVCTLLCVLPVRGACTAELACVGGGQCAAVWRQATPDRPARQRKLVIHTAQLPRVLFRHLSSSGRWIAHNQMLGSGLKQQVVDVLVPYSSSRLPM